MVPLTVNPSGQLEKHRPLCEYRPSLHFVQKFRLKHASQFSILHSEIKKDNNSYILILQKYIFLNNSAYFWHWTTGPPIWWLIIMALRVSYPKSSKFKNVKTLMWFPHTSVSLYACCLWSNLQTASNWGELWILAEIKPDTYQTKQNPLPHP